jgi:hypothetical protein
MSAWTLRGNIKGPSGGGSSVEGFIYEKDIATSAGLHTYVTATLLTGTMIVIANGQHFRLTVGAADSADPGQVAPDDFNATTNNRHWEQVL